MTDNTTNLKQCGKKVNCIHPERQGDGWLPAVLDYFRKDKSTKSGLTSHCKACLKQYYNQNKDAFSEAHHQYYENNKGQIIRRTAIWAKNNPDKVQQTSKKWRQNNKEQAKQATLKWRENNPDKVANQRIRFKQQHPHYHRDYYSKHPDKLDKKKEKDKIWIKIHPDKPAIYSKTYRDKNLEKRREENRIYLKKNPEINRTKSRNYHARKHKAQGTHTLEQVRTLYKKQRGRCFYCNTKLNDKYHADHVMPISRGGSNYISNIVVACSVCNESKGGKLLHEWRGGGGRLI